MPQNHIPLVDLRLAHRRVAEQIATGFDRVLASSAFVLGPAVATFEAEFAAYCGVEYCVGVGNGTDALELALLGVGVGPHDEVIVPANTFVATAEAVARTGATIVLADVTSDHLIDPSSVAERLTPATRAVIAVHLYGQIAPMGALRAVIGDGVALVEDAAQSHGARQHGQRSGALGDAAATSFYPGKNLGAYGDGGAVMTRSEPVANYLRAVRNHGGIARYEHRYLGRNSRLDSLQAAVLSAKLTVLDEWNGERRAAAMIYHELLADIESISIPRTAPGNEHAWHLYVIEADDRDRLVADLNAANIGAGIHYPAPIHLLPAFAGLGYSAGDFPTTESAGRRIMSLPIYPGITFEQQVRVVATLRASLRAAELLGSPR